MPPEVPWSLLLLITHSCRKASEHDALQYIKAAAAHTRGQRQSAAFIGRAFYLYSVSSFRKLVSMQSGLCKNHPWRPDALLLTDILQTKTPLLPVKKMYLSITRFLSYGLADFGCSGQGLRTTCCLMQLKSASFWKKEWFLWRGQRKKVLRFPLQEASEGSKSVSASSSPGSIFCWRSQCICTKTEVPATLMKATRSLALVQGLKPQEKRSPLSRAVKWADGRIDDQVQKPFPRLCFWR